VNASEASSVFVAGELAGLAMRLDVKALEQFLDGHPAGFGYEAICRAAIRFRGELSEFFGDHAPVATAEKKKR
jgi:hypothetical protein